MFGKLFSKKANDKEVIVKAPLTGELIPLEQVPDPVFAQKIVGDGVAIKPSEGVLIAPVRGKVLHLASTFHAIGIVTDEGLELLLHIGIDTVKLDGRGFNACVKEGDQVEVGDKLIEFDIATIEQAGFSTITPVLVTNGDKVDSRKQETTGQVQAGLNEVIVLSLK
ncbi:PTS sugar transporter subunit IIA [Brevibacillus sp. SYSU BS000544]|uniref:PTS sugar transporter subunit IIA n=1 Tax=Brevibacillus sp. SYSU BS000544 TaxID=3416443 RepID=UPI003CE4815C